MRATVKIDSHFRAYQREVDRAIGRTLSRAGDGVRRVARSVDEKGYNVGGIVGDSTVGPLERTSRGWRVRVVWKDFRAVFFERGTSAKKGRSRYGKTAAKRRAAGIRSGVKAIHFARKAAKVIQARLAEMLANEIKW